MADNERQYILGRPYVLWNSRPAKNGQPPTCYGQCNINIGTRKVGAAMRRLPELQYGMKAKEEILQKWDPISRSLVNIHYRAPPPTFNSATLTVTPPLYNFGLNYYESQFFVSFKTSLENVQVSLKIYKVGSPDVAIYDQAINSNSQGGITVAAQGILGESYYAVVAYNDLLSTSLPVSIQYLSLILDSAGPRLFEAKDYYPGYNNQLFRIQYIANIETSVKYELYNVAGLRIPLIDYKNGGSIVDYVIYNTSEGFINLIFDATPGMTYYAVITPNGGSIINTVVSSPPYSAVLLSVSLSLVLTSSGFPSFRLIRNLTGTWTLNVPSPAVVSLYRSSLGDPLTQNLVITPFNVPDTTTSYTFTDVDPNWVYTMRVQPIITDFQSGATVFGITVTSNVSIVV